MNDIDFGVSEGIKHIHVMNLSEVLQMILLMDQLCGQTDENEVSRYDFAQEIFKVTQKEITTIPCSSEEFITKAKRLKFSKLK